MGRKNMFAFTSAGEGLLPVSGTWNSMQGLNCQSCDQRETVGSL